ncbi:2-succinyl-5-enolpyruvyl-6-hydroxy-3-cyclohexene-1-carboxylic-acid synthase [Thiorhodococcus minor]|uniref:2-succinyl-5-enolpyruvyl-6-hydroxy-3-cyclohexene-1-carboxylate synthase n=1 Tax=Thiorhodococcus minor TaxID=57489 RepID=A0A6M0K2T5_9GAMM|nr:2-succinyl-5-enolpyruvyl-6-hydroxy-3-cyclohexene-1-carboxylic-acid synthase [Thiorhodococcus minor]NEV64030.1 2-succinyl-5-enolpyruvyl-6-hydroxy-3-cyclohexene-1-carboxylic-acid synthase [Thiorhodococcus minor]
MSSQQRQACVNLQWSLALMDGLIAGGMRRLVISPGSRSTPLVLAAQRRPELELTAILDERSAAFFALGLARASDRPVGILCTSGSAPAHWLPAVIEASESEIPLILLSADRPPELRGWGANQTVDQNRLFGSYVREFHDPGPAEDAPAALKMMRALGLRAASMSLATPTGPVHLNLPFREPLVPDADCPGFALAEPETTAGPEAQQGPARRPCATQTLAGRGAPTPTDLPLGAGKGLICCGPGAWSAASADALWALAARLDVPVLCDPLSGLRFGPAGPGRITRYDGFLRNARIAAELRPDWVIRFGRAPVSKTLLGWLADIPTLLVDPGGRWSDPNHDVRWQLHSDAQTFCRSLLATDLGSAAAAAAHADWAPRWTRLEGQVDRLASQHLDEAPWCEAHIISDLLELLPADEGLLCANSMPIRQVDTWSGGRDKGLQVFGNRGASGIDGQTSTLAGLNAGGIPTTALLGDLSFLHDLSGLHLLRALERPCIVINNGGGRIFDYLPQHGLSGFEQLWRTPMAIALKRLAEPFGLEHRLAADRDALRKVMQEVLTTSGPGPSGCVIEVIVDAEVSRAAHRQFWHRLASSRLD